MARFGAEPDSRVEHQLAFLLLIIIFFVDNVILEVAAHKLFEFSPIHPQGKPLFRVSFIVGLFVELETSSH